MGTSGVAARAATTEADLRAALHASGVVGVWEWDVPQRRIILDHGAAGLIAGDARLAGRPLSVEEATTCIHPDDQGWLTDYIFSTARVGGSFLCEYRVCTPGGEERWLLSRGRIDLGEDGQPVLGHGILIDITESRSGGQTFFAIPDDPSAHPLERAADHCVAAREALSGAGNSVLQTLIDVALWEIGRELARLERAQRRRAMN
ncbi:PAS domain-containing protein [Methylobacterium durans]|uniref:PAS domain-containing protein n=1 Tax=Methylobacterium durans TaxID=2202825 RepID=UPI002AFF3CD4|nr:PAS domain-containing protein [Methylobacterium durans]MEA1834797.1 PAS domain-containing protein [Methylobacterium durans]